MLPRSATPLPYFGTKSTYPSPPSPADSSVRSPVGYQIIHVSFIARHGTRNPTKNGIERMRTLEAFLCDAAPNLPWLESWSSVLDGYESREGDLTPLGIAEMKAMGRRFQARYQHLVIALNSLPPLARSSSKRRAVESAAAFLDGYCSNLPADCPVPVTRVLGESEDHVVRYTERNPHYYDYSVHHKNELHERLKTGKSPRALLIARRMACHLGVNSLRPELVRVVAEAAAYDVAHGRGAASPFLRLLRRDDSPFLEAFDRSFRPYIHNFHQFRSIAAPLIRDLVNTLTAAADGRAPPADLKFAHSQTLVPFLILLRIDGNGLDTRSNEYVPGLVGMAPFAANFTVELFRKISNPVTNTPNRGRTGKLGPYLKEFVVRFRLQERYVTCVPALGEHGRDGTVTLDKLLEFFQGVIEEEENHARLQKVIAQGGAAGIRKSPSLPTAPVMSPVVPGVLPGSVPTASCAIEQRVFE